MVLNFIKSILNVAKFEDEEKNRVAGIINTVAIVIIVGLMLILGLRIFFERLSFINEVILVIIILIFALILLRYGKIIVSGFLVIYSLFGLTIFLAVYFDGLHDYALFAIPGLLVIAGFIFKKPHFYLFLIICLLTVLIIGIVEITGMPVNKFSAKTTYFDIVDILVIFGLTAITIRMFSERLRRSLVAARMSEQAIKESEQKVRALLSALPDLMLRISSEGVFKDFAAPDSFQLAFKSEDFLGKNICDLFPKEVSDKTLNAIRAANKNNSVEQFEYQLNFNNVVSNWEARMVSLDGNDVITIIRDISERKRTEEALVLSEEIFKSFMEYSPIYVFFKDQDTRVLRLSKNYEQMLNMPVSKMIGKTMFELFPSELAKNMTEDDLKILKQGKMAKITEDLNGRIFDTIKFPIAVKNKPKYLAGFTIDVTETKLHETQLRHYAEELKEANIAKEKFFSIIAHDLRSPFLGILGSIQMLSTEYNILSDEERKQLIERVGSSIRKTFELLENLLNWSRVQSGKIAASLSPLFLNKEIGPVVTLLKDFAQNKNVVLESKLKAGHKVLADRDMLKTIIRNLISNAVKFSIPGGKIEVSSEERDDSIVVKIADNGVGMDDETLNNLFKIDRSHSRLGTSNESGTGIGLLVCKEMIELNNGHIWVESSEGGGSTFLFSLPKAE